MNCERERFRFRETNRVIWENFGHPHKLLELGCGEGFQSDQLQQVCDHLYGIDVSRRAVRRARRRCPQATFAIDDIYGMRRPTSLAPFDLVTACEIFITVRTSAGPYSAFPNLVRRA